MSFKFYRKIRQYHNSEVIWLAVATYFLQMSWLFTNVVAFYKCCGYLEHDVFNRNFGFSFCFS